MRRRRAPRSEPDPDAKYNSRLISKFINSLMKEGKRSLAEKIVYDALAALEKKLTDETGVKIFNKALENVRPKLEVKARRVGGATYQVPVEVPISRGNALAMRWVRDFARKKKGKAMQVKLADELLAAYKGVGASVKKREDTHKMADSNKAFSHLKW